MSREREEGSADQVDLARYSLSSEELTGPISVYDPDNAIVWTGKMTNTCKRVTKHLSNNIQTLNVTKKVEAYDETKSENDSNTEAGSCRCSLSDDCRVDPFIVYDDGYGWPNLHDEIDEMLEVNAVVYPLVELRRKARENHVDQDILKLPLTHEQVRQTIVKNRNKLLDTRFVKRDFYQDVFKQAMERHSHHVNPLVECEITEDETGSDSEGSNRSSLSIGSLVQPPSLIVAFDDEFEQEKLVYSIEVNKYRQRVTVCFRGSITKSDLAADVAIYMKEVPNPLRWHRSQQKTIRVHCGFFNYLFRPNPRGTKGPDGKVLTEYEEIMQEHVVPLLRQNPGFKVRHESVQF